MEATKVHETDKIRTTSNREDTGYDDCWRRTEMRGLPSDAQRNRRSMRRNIGVNLEEHRLRTETCQHNPGERQQSQNNQGVTEGVGYDKQLAQEWRTIIREC